MKKYMHAFLLLVILIGTSANASFIIPNKSVTQIKKANMATGSTVAAGGFASAIYNNFSTTSSTPVSVTGASVTITSTGRPLFVGLAGTFASANQPYIGAVVNSGAATQVQCIFYLTNSTNSTTFNIANIIIAGASSSLLGSFIPVGSVWGIDWPAAGTYTYILQMASNTANTNCIADGGKLIAYEI